ncbi:acyl-CoA thioesterase [Actinomadura parmotrematis]|uniref:Acyl-CoA thioesterase n=1 Tax=Actinomadura parmotrematis TaxID=2864039 RepID=A0ABS7FQZ8_9ACTN|nr:thioesterase family protein [Actinomadura parmotrematis]MBW8482400.1 acyl-CoA thioesterase [Actinomadura parmotrematis]
MSDPFSVPVTVRGYELDSLGHLNQAVYLQYAEHARWLFLEAAGLALDRLSAAGVGPVVLETTIRYLRELRAGDEVSVSCAFSYGGGKVFTIAQQIAKADGTVAADLTMVGGVLDLKERRLVPDPGARFASLATDPSLLGL